MALIEVKKLPPERLSTLRATAFIIAPRKEISARKSFATAAGTPAGHVTTGTAET